MSDENRHPNTGWWIAATLAVLLSVYVGGYFLASEYTRAVHAGVTVNSRTFAVDALIWGYVPLGWAECRLRGEPVALASRDYDLVDGGRFIWFDP